MAYLTHVQSFLSFGTHGLEFQLKQKLIKPNQFSSRVVLFTHVQELIERDFILISIVRKT